MSNAHLEKEADELERQAKAELANKNYDLALLFYMDAKDIYLQIGFQGRVGVIDKQIARIKRLMELEKEKKVSVSKTIEEKKILEQEGNDFLQKAKNLFNEGNYESALILYQKAYKSFEELGLNYQCKQINWEINKIKVQSQKDKPNSLENMDASELSIAEQRRIRIQKQQEQEQKKREYESQQYLMARNKQIVAKKQKEEDLKGMTEGMKLQQKIMMKRMQESSKVHYDQRKKELEMREKKLKMLEEKKKQEEEQINRADKALDLAKSLVDQKEFQKAKDFYNQAIEIFATLGWEQQVMVLKSELRNIDKYEEEHKEKLKQEFLKKKKQEKAFQQRVDAVLAEKKKAEEERLAKLRALSPEIQNKMKRAKDAIIKGEKEASMEKFQRAIGRFEYAIELYKSIPHEKIDLGIDISNLEEKISELKAKM
ncbi:MAG: hypothetical protein ACTSR8_17725 [Promethearchaeota archaeon]